MINVKSNLKNWIKKISKRGICHLARSVSEKPSLHFLITEIIMLWLQKIC